MSSTGDSAVADAPLRIIAGPTGAGKSALAMRLAERRGATIVSADSRQVYRGFDIGTAKPTAAERRRVRHEGIDVADPEERWSAARFAREAEGWLARATEEGRTVIVVGGTGFWLRALVEPLAAEPPMAPDRRRAMQAALDGLDTGTLRRWVERLDPPRARLGRTQLLRAAEVALLTGTRLSDAFHEPGAGTVRAARWVVVDPGPSLAARLEERVDAMLAAGWEEEVRRLVDEVAPDAPAWNACGYELIRDVVQGRLSRDAARERVIIATRQYAKRQRTWFRHQLREAPHLLRLDPRAADAAALVERWLFGGTDA